MRKPQMPSLRIAMNHASYLLQITFLSLAILFGTVNLGYAQNITATMTGTVTDASGSVVPGAQVSLSNELSGDVRKTVTNSAGYFTFAAVPAGSFSLNVEATGFQRFVRKGIVVNSSERVVADAALQIGSATQTVEVNASAESVNTVDSGDKTNVLDTAALQNIATVGRSAAELIKLMPGFAQTGNGVTNYPGYDGSAMGINGNGNAGRQSAVGYFAASGTPTSSMEVVSDGAHVTDPGCNCATPVNPNPEMIQEARVLQNAFSADNAKGPVVVSTITKAGGSTFHGEIYASLRNPDLNANDWLNNRAGLSRAQNKYFFPGANIGGPVLLPHTGFNRNRNKLFFFIGFEYFSQHLTSAPVNATVPTARMLQGDFSLASIAEINPSLTTPGAPTTAGNPQPVNTTLYPGGRIDPNLFDKGGLALTKLFPAPNANPLTNTGFNYVLQVTFPQNGWQQVERIDYSVSDNTKLFVRYYHQQEVQNFPIQLWGQGSNQVPYPSPVVGRNHSESIAGDLTHVFSPSLTNEFVMAYTYIGFPNTFENPQAVTKGTAGYPYVGFYNSGNTQIPNVNTGISLISNNGGFQAGGGTLFANKPLASMSDNIVKVWQTHTFKAGYYLEWYANFQPGGGAANGTITESPTNPTGTGNVYADLLTGRVSNYSQNNFNNVGRNSSWENEFFVQDSWKVTRRLQLEIGMRFQHDPEANDRYNLGHAVWVPSAWTNSTTAILPGIQWYATNHNIPNSGYPTRPIFFVPRFGEAFDVFGNGKTVIRGGIGMYRYRGSTGGGGVAEATPTGSFTSTLSTFTTQGSTLAAIDGGKYPVPSFSSYQLAYSGLADQNSSQLSMTWTYNFTISQKLPKNIFFEAAYVGTMARHLTESVLHNVNAVPYGAMLATPTASQYPFRPYPNYSDLVVTEFDSYSNYNALQLNANHRGTHYFWTANYTYSKVLGLASTIIDPFTAGNNYGPLNFDRRNIFNAAYSYSFGKLAANRWAGLLANDWNISGVVQMQTGAMLQFNSTGNNFNLLATLPNKQTSINITGTPNVQAMPVLTCDPTKGLGTNQYLNSKCFALPTPGNNGPIMEPEAFGPGFFNTDLSVFKTFRISESKSVQFRAEGFNFLNHPNATFTAGDPNLNLVFNAAGLQTNSLFGIVNSKIGHRIGQVALKFYF
jgi:hypothetical protein